jgi:hypothetical protein
MYEKGIKQLLCTEIWYRGRESGDEGGGTRIILLDESETGEKWYLTGFSGVRDALYLNRHVYRRVCDMLERGRHTLEVLRKVRVQVLKMILLPTSEEAPT